MRPKLDWNDFQLLGTIAHAGSFTAAAKRLGIGQATVSRRVTHIERAVGFPLFVRRENTLEILPVVETLLPTILRMTEIAHTLEEMLRTGRTAAPVVVRSYEGMLSLILIPLYIGKLHPRHGKHIRPTARIADTDIRFVDEAATEPAQIEFRIVPSGEVPKFPSTFVAKRLTEVTFFPMTHTRYFQARRRPASAEDLESHVLATSSPSETFPPFAKWNAHFRRGGSNRIRTTSYSVLTTMVEEGDAIVPMPSFAALLLPGVEVAVPDLRMTADLWVGRDRLAVEQERIQGVQQDLVEALLEVLQLGERWIAERGGLPSRPAKFRLIDE